MEILKSKASSVGSELRDSFSKEPTATHHYPRLLYQPLSTIHYPLSTHYPPTIYTHYCISLHIPLHILPSSTITVDTTSYLLSATSYLLFTTYYLLPSTSYSPLKPLPTSYLLFTTYCLPLSTQYLLLTTNCLLFAAFQKELRYAQGLIHKEVEGEEVRAMSSEEYGVRSKEQRARKEQGVKKVRRRRAAAFQCRILK